MKKKKLINSIHLTKITARKRFGQNFLQDGTIIAAIINALNLQEHDAVIEIGPGLGALTAPLLQRIKTLIAIEIDRSLPPILMRLPQAKEKLIILQADALS